MDTRFDLKLYLIIIFFNIKNCKHPWINLSYVVNKYIWFDLITIQ